MLKGNNILKLNEATIIAAIEEYLNARIGSLTDEVKVTGVNLENSSVYSKWFVVTTGEREPKA